MDLKILRKMNGIRFWRLYTYFGKTIQINPKRFLCNEVNINKYRNILKLDDRGMFQDLFPDTSANTISSMVMNSPQCVYAGFDPTADSLHIGNLLVLMNLLHWQRGGHKVIAVVGGATGLLGDPSGRETERIPMNKEIINSNICGIQNDITTVFNNHAQYFWKNQKQSLGSIEIMNNIDWYKNIHLLEFFNNYGKHFRMGTMLIKNSVQSRLKSETGMSFTEFSYQIFQAYDWLYLMKNFNCRFQIGGNDQLGNIVAGHELIHRVLKKEVFGFTVPLLTVEGGQKFGKSLGNAIWLSPKRSSSFQLYQYFIRTTDSNVENYLKLFTFLPITQINHIMKEHNNEPEKRKAQQILAENVTLLIHGEEGLSAAQNASLLLYDKSLDTLSALNQEQIAVAFAGAQIVNLIPERKMTVFDLAMKAKCFKSEHDAVRIIQAGGFYMNYRKMMDLNQVIDPDKHILPNNITLLRTGKRTFVIVQWIELQRKTKKV